MTNTFEQAGPKEALSQEMLPGKVMMGCPKIISEESDADAIFSFNPKIIDKKLFNYIFYPNSAGTFNINESYAINDNILFSGQTYKGIDNTSRQFCLYDEILSIYADRNGIANNVINHHFLWNLRKECDKIKSLYFIKGRTFGFNFGSVLNSIRSSDWIIQPSTNKRDFVKERVQLILNYTNNTFEHPITLIMKFNYDIIIPGYKYNYSIPENIFKKLSVSEVSECPSNYNLNSDLKSDLDSELKSDLDSDLDSELEELEKELQSKQEERQKLCENIKLINDFKLINDLYELEAPDFVKADGKVETPEFTTQADEVYDFVRRIRALRPQEGGVDLDVSTVTTPTTAQAHEAAPAPPTADLIKLKSGKMNEQV